MMSSFYFFLGLAGMLPTRVELRLHVLALPPIELVEVRYWLKDHCPILRLRPVPL